MDLTQLKQTCNVVSPEQAVEKVIFSQIRSWANKSTILSITNLRFFKSTRRSAVKTVSPKGAKTENGVLNEETGWVKIICISLFQQALR